jgi:prephenate dehydrogenase
MKTLSQAEFTIVGTGLMGTSLALALRGKVGRLRGIDSSAAYRYAAAVYFDEIGNDLEPALASADVVILATPIKAIIGLLAKVGAMVRPGTLIIDLGSAKQQIVLAMDGLPDSVLAVGGHPMCGKEQSGPTVADGTLYHGCVFVLCPSQRTTPEALDFARAMIRAIGARAIVMPADRHDTAVAAISHLPYLLSVGLVAAVQNVAQNDPMPWKLASSGFRDTSRLAGSDITMMGDTLLTNREAVLDALRVFRTQLDILESILQMADERALRGILDSARQARLEWPQKRDSAQE